MLNLLTDLAGSLHPLPDDQSRVELSPPDLAGEEGWLQISFDNNDSGIESLFIDLLGSFCRKFTRRSDERFSISTTIAARRDTMMAVM